MAKHEKVKVDKRSKAYRDEHHEKQRKKGHQPKKIDWKEVDKMLISGCNGEQVAAVLGIHADTLYIRCQKDKAMGFSAYVQQKRQKGNSYLHSKQFNLAMQGDRSMLIWLGKQRLDQRDNRDVKLEGTTSINVVNFSDKKMKTWQEEQKIYDDDSDSDSEL